METNVDPAVIEEAIGMELFWTIPHDQLLRKSGQLGQAIVEANPKSAASRCFTELARVLGGLPPEPRVDGLIGRLFAGRNGKAQHQETVEALKAAQEAMP